MRFNFKKRGILRLRQHYPYFGVYEEEHEKMRRLPKADKNRDKEEKCPKKIRKAIVHWYLK